MNRDNRTGRFTRIIDEVNTGFDFLLMIWKSIPLMILIFFIYKYYDLGNFSNRIIMETICGKEGRKENENGHGSFGK